jgi:hypothetical protein
MSSRPEQKNAKIHPPLGVTTKTDFVFTQPRSIPPPSFMTGGDRCSAETGRRGGCHGFGLGHETDASPFRGSTPANSVLRVHDNTTWKYGTSNRGAVGADDHPVPPDDTNSPRVEGLKALHQSPVTLPSSANKSAANFAMTAPAPFSMMNMRGRLR